MSNVDIGAVGNKDIGAVQSAAASGGETVNALTATYSLTALTATFLTAEYSTINAALEEFNITANPATFNTPEHSTINALTANFSITPSVATVDVTILQLIRGATANYSITPQIATLDYVLYSTINAALEDFVITPYSASFNDGTPESTLVVHDIAPILYSMSDIREVFQITVNFVAGAPDIQILSALERHSAILLGFRYKATANGSIRFSGDTGDIIDEYYEEGESYGRSPDKGFVLASPVGEALYFGSDTNGSCLLFVAYYNSLAI